MPAMAQMPSMASMNQHPLAHHEGWMVSGWETFSVGFQSPKLTMVVSSVAFFAIY
jgi:hypothetical protein